MREFFCSWLAVALLLLPAATVAAGDDLEGGAAEPLHLVLNSPFSAPITSPAGDGFLDLLYAELFDRLGTTFEIQLLPGERALRNADAGIDDGDVCRIAGLDEVYPNLRRTTEAVLEYRMTVFSRKHDFTVLGSESLLPYELGFLSGWKILEYATEEHPRRRLVDETDQLFLMLAHDRLELVLIDRILGLEAVARLGIQGVKILEPPLLQGHWYLYLHQRHQHLLPAIDRELRRLKEDGTYERVRRQAFGAFEQFDPEEHLP
ncbi:substrate-binding periplasmic protein [Desulfurivibrio dismutans]|uniref:substrate-binding periplasmic protein n=1 Tax=Desulfurivibrio dismutans TaxID=1398908 RepID=UPI0023DC8F51|nr:transporter substrate-binding domain-containing protein [Desulfurivibrio alkaliphilus]MDF1614167.1 transporter substrate-binding domain-containing protein [Desulfurivibrio alkaliphilus]